MVTTNRGLVWHLKKEFAGAYPDRDLAVSAASRDNLRLSPPFYRHDTLPFSLFKVAPGVWGGPTAKAQEHWEPRERLAHRRGEVSLYWLRLPRIPQELAPTILRSTRGRQQATISIPVTRAFEFPEMVR